MLTIQDLHAKIDDKQILQGLNLKVNAGEVHAIMGPNGSGKSTLAKILAGEDGYAVTSGSVDYDGQDLLQLAPEERAWAGLFLAFQYPIAIPGVNNIYLLKASVNAIREYRGEPKLDAVEFMALIREKIKIIDMKEELFNRAVNEGFSGGEKKRNEIFQLMVLEPKLAILDEIDSGLDIDALKVVAKGINSIRDKSRAVIIVTHYQRLLNYVEPDYVHVLHDGKIIKSGGADFALEIEGKGYDWIPVPAT